MGIRDIAAYRFRSGNLTGGNTPELLGIATVSANFFRLFGGRTTHGRTFLAEEDQAGGREVAVLGYDFWRRRFDGDPNMVGTVVSLDGVPRLVVGVLDIGAVPHGFRSSFRDWAAEETNHPREVVEAALAHVIQNKVEAAYARSDLFERRRLLMADWAAYLDGGRENAG